MQALSLYFSVDAHRDEGERQSHLSGPVDEVVQFSDHKLGTVVQSTPLGRRGCRLLSAIRYHLVSGRDDGGELGASEQRQLA